MDDLGIVTLNKEAKTVTLGANADAVEEYLPGQRGGESVLLEVTVVLVISTIVVLGVLNIGPLSTVPLLFWAGVTILSLLGLAGFQRYKRR